MIFSKDKLDPWLKTNLSDQLCSSKNLDGLSQAHVSLDCGTIDFCYFEDKSKWARRNQEMNFGNFKITKFYNFFEKHFTIFFESCRYCHLCVDLRLVKWYCLVSWFSWALHKGQCVHKNNKAYKSFRHKQNSATFLIRLLAEIFNFTFIYLWNTKFIYNGNSPNNEKNKSVGSVELYTKVNVCTKITKPTSHFVTSKIVQRSW